MNSVKLRDTRLICRNLLLFYTLKIKYQKEKTKNITFNIASKRIKYIGINLTLEMKDSENYITLMKETEDYTKK